MRVGSVSNRYAKALFELAKDKGALDAVERDVEFLAAEMANDAVANFLFDGRIPLEEKTKRLEFIEPHVNPLTYNFVRLLCEKRRLEVLRELGAAFRRRSLAEKGAVEGVVESARPLSDDDVTSLATALGKLLGKTVQLKPEIDTDLIGGVRVFVDNKMLDQSLRGRLDGLRDTLMSARVGTGDADATAVAEAPPEQNETSE